MRWYITYRPPNTPPGTRRWRPRGDRERPADLNSAGLDEYATYLRPPGVAGIEALHARYVTHAYRPHSHATWTIAVVRSGAARFEVQRSRQRADAGELFVLEPEAVHTGMAAIPEGWDYQVLYVDPELLNRWALRDGPAPRAARWVVFRDPALRRALLHAHAWLGAQPSSLGTGVSLAVEEKVLAAVAGLGPHLRARVGEGDRPARGEHAAVRRARRLLTERWDQPVTLTELADAAGLSRFELIRRFSAQEGITPYAFQRHLRVAHARTLLRAGEPPAGVAATCGFADQPHLTRVFKRMVGVTPAAFARAGSQ